MENYPDVVIEIHNSVINDSKSLEIELKKTPEQMKFLKGKMSKLRMVGMNFTKDSKSSVSLIEEYNRLSLMFPGYLIVDEGTEIRLAEKYDLVTAQLGSYQGFIPNKNLNDIDQFLKIYSKHNCYTELRDRSDWKDKKMKFDLNAYLESDDFDETTFEELAEEDGMLGYKGVFPVKYFIDPPFELLGTQRAATLVYQKPQMSISAPRKDIIMGPRQYVDANRRVRNLPDPIVYLNCKHGLRVVATKWGDESKDPELNSIFN